MKKKRKKNRMKNKNRYFINKYFIIILLKIYLIFKYFNKYSINDFKQTIKLFLYNFMFHKLTLTLFKIIYEK